MIASPKVIEVESHRGTPQGAKATHSTTTL